MATDRKSNERVAVVAARLLTDLDVDKQSNDDTDRVIEKCADAAKDQPAR